MGFFFSLLYIALAILSPGEAVPALAPFRIQLWLALAAILTSLPVVLEARSFFVAQAGFLLAVILGLIASFMWMGWFGGILPALAEFIPSAIVFYLVVANFRTITRLRFLVSVLVLVSLYLVIWGGIAYLRGDPHDPMILAQWNEDNTAWFPRMRAFGFLNDPNDLAQFLITVGPLLWLGWQAGRFLTNAWRVLLPAAVLLLGVFLTHSRGGIVALAAVLLFAFKDKIGRTRAALLAVLAFIAMKAFNFSGGRDVSMGAGSDRIDAWSQGLEMFRSSPAFGVGYHQFVEHAGMEAHNTFVHCAAELGLFGYYFWLALIVFSLSDLGTIASNKLAPQSDQSSDSACDPSLDQPTSLSHVAHAEYQPSVTTLAMASEESEGLPREPERRETLRQWATLLRISFIGYLTAAFFLSRAYTITLFLLVGMATVLRLIAISEGSFVPAFPSRRLYRLTAQISVASLAFVYVIVRIRWLR
jgi:O-Antigen ligase